jgi:hypothetical protein
VIAVPADDRSAIKMIRDFSIEKIGGERHVNGFFFAIRRMPVSLKEV